MLNEPLTVLLVVLAVFVVGVSLVKLEDRLREWWRWTRGPGWIERKARRRSKGSKEEKR